MVEWMIMLCNFVFVEDEFQKLQRSFLHKYYKEFDDTEENKFIYTDIHKSYVRISQLCLIQAYQYY